MSQWDGVRREFDEIREGYKGLLSPRVRFTDGVFPYSGAGIVRVEFIVFGVCYSMKNSKIPRKHGRGMVKHPKALAFERDFLTQVPPEYRNLALEGPLRCVVVAYYPSRRQDLDCALVYDCLQKSGVVKNDRDIVEKHEYREVSKDSPRVEISLEAI